MKYFTKMTLFSAIFTSLFAQADTAEYKECRGEGEIKSCFTYKINFPSYSYPWLTDFVLQESFSREDVNIESLDDLVKAYVQEAFSEEAPEESSEESESDDWSGAEEAGGFIQVAKTLTSNLEGAAYGLESINYYVFEKDNHASPIPVEEIVVEGAEDKLGKVLEEFYIQWQVNTGISKEEAQDVLKNFAENGNLPVADSWYFAKDMIVFSYAPYQIGPYSYGTIELPLPVNRLKGLIKEQYLQVGSAWKTPFNAQ